MNAELLYEKECRCYLLENNLTGKEQMIHIRRSRGGLRPKSHFPPVSASQSSLQPRLEAGQFPLSQVHRRASQRKHDDLPFSYHFCLKSVWSTTVGQVQLTKMDQPTEHSRVGHHVQQPCLCFELLQGTTDTRGTTAAWWRYNLDEFVRELNKIPSVHWLIVVLAKTCLMAFSSILSLRSFAIFYVTRHINFYKFTQPYRSVIASFLCFCEFRVHQQQCAYTGKTMCL